MSPVNEVEFTLKVMINKQKTKVLFAEVDSDFADVLLSFLALPLGTIVRVLKKHYGDKEAPVFGSLTTLHDGLKNLDIITFSNELNKNIFPRRMSSLEAECRKLKLDISDPCSIKYFSCEDWNCEYRRSKRSMYSETTTCRCGKTMDRVVCLEESQSAADGAGGAFTIKEASFLISDDLRMVPNVAVSFVQTLRNLGIADTDGAELRNVTFRCNEIMDLLKSSLVSRTPLTDIILNKRKVVDDFGRLKYEAGILLHEKKLEATKMMNLRLVVRKSKNKLLFAQAEDNFVDFLLLLLAIPLGGVESLLDSNTCVTSIDNLYRSILDFMDDKYWATRDIKNRLTKPNLPKGYISENTILPLSEQVLIYYHQDFEREKEWISYHSGNSGWYSALQFGGRAKNNYVKGTKKYMVTDDLTVTPLCMTSTLSILNDMKIPLSDVKEVEVNIGLEEALSILKASLTSTSALTDGLKINRMLTKQPKHPRGLIRAVTQLFR